MSYYDPSYISNEGLMRQKRKLTDLLCFLCRELEKRQLLGSIIQDNQALDLRRFWNSEKKAFGKRESKQIERRKALARKEAEKIRLEKLKESGRAKLTTEEAIALNLLKPQKNTKNKQGKNYRR